MGTPVERAVMLTEAPELAPSGGADATSGAGGREPRPRRRRTSSIADRAWAAWRVQALARIEELRYQFVRMGFDANGGRPDGAAAADHPAPSAVTKVTVQHIAGTLDRAELRARGGWWPPWRAVANALTGGDVEYVWRTIHAADVELLRIADPADLAGRSAEIDATTTRYLPATDSRREDLHRRFIQGKGVLTRADSAAAVAAYQAALAEFDSQQRRVRSFRNVLLATTLVMAGAVIVLALLAARWPNALDLCAVRNQCPTGAHREGPTGGDVILVELLGAAAAMLIGATSLARVRGTATPYAVPMVTALLKVPTGALTAVLGLSLILADVVPGVRLTTSGQVVAWAIVLGAGQQTFTQLVDRQAQAVLNNVGSSDKASPQNQ
jgi:hypothetical protein